MKFFCSASNDTSAFEYGPEPLDAASTYYIAVDGFAGGFCDFRLSLFGAEIDPLPVELISFQATCMEDKKETLLEWTTLSEINNRHFTVEKSHDAKTFVPLAVILGSRNSNVINNYNHTIKSNDGGTSYYRLKQTDFNGHINYSNIIANTCGSNNDVTMYPNPADSHITIETTGERGDVISIQILDSRGRVLYDNSEELTGDKFSTKIEISSISNGVYPIIIQNGNYTISKRLIINR